MRLNQLQMTGFKSFRDTTTIQFDGGITGVVGPNGCGKSNIVDAVLWVTGSMVVSQLRGDQMEDIIFSGTQSSKPSVLAEVCLTLEKDQGEWPEKFQSLSEFTITRRLKRGGDSQYLINNEVCLLRDIQELIMDMGALGFSIVEQDTISQMISAKPDQMRALIEQVAGTAKFKNKKRLAQNKLKITCQNMQRLEDILLEQKKQLRRLEKQARQAQTYKELKNHVMNIELSFLKSRYDEVEGKIKKLNSSVQVLFDQELHKKNNLKTLQDQYHKIRTQSEKIYSNLIAERQRLRKKLEDLNQSEIKAQRLKTLIDSNSEKTNQWAVNISDFKDSQKQKIKEINMLKAQMEKNKNQMDLLQKDFENKQAQFEKKQLQYSLLEKAQNDNKSQMDLHYREEMEKGEILKSLKKEIEKSEQSFTELQNQLKDKASRYQSLKNNCVKIQKNLETEKACYLNLKEEIRCVKENISALQLPDKKQKLDALHMSLIQKESQQKSLLLLKEKTESQMKGYQWVKKEKSLCSLLEVLDVEPSFERAVSSVLDSFLHGFVVENLDSAEKMLQELKEKSLGQVLFLLCRDLKKKSHPKSSHHLGTCLQDKVRMKSGALKNPSMNLDFLFESVFVVDSIKKMIALSKDYPDCIFVTKCGDIVKYGHFLGSPVHQELDFLVQEKEIQSLNHQVDELKSQKSILEKEIQDQSKNFKNLEKHLSQLNKKYMEEDKVIYSQSKELEVFQKELSFVEQDYKNLDKKSKNHKQDQKNRISLKNKMESQYLKIQKEKQARQVEYDQADQQLQRCLEQRNQFKSSVDVAHLSLLFLQKDLKIHQYQMNFLTQSINEMDQKTLKFSQQSNQNTEFIKKNQLELKKIESQIVDEKQKYEQKETVQEAHEQDYQNQLSQYKILETKIADLKQNLDEFLEKKHQNEVEIETLCVEKKNLEEKTLENYQMDLRTVNKETYAIAEEDSQNLSQLKSQLSQMGQVNLLALSEYDELNKEYTDLQKQFDDLDQSKRELEQVITEMDQISTKKFKKAFEEVNRRLTQVFTAVFGGGQASLVLTNEDPKGVEILACPPGKKLKNLKLLSGGEKSLTALSMIFSLFLVRPAPFCVLDEVDAALDDSNVLRFNTLVKEMAQQCQVILITHNKYSMKECHRLYGVTMEEKGITNLLSVDVQDYQSELSV